MAHKTACITLQHLHLSTLNQQLLSLPVDTPVGAIRDAAWTVGSLSKHSVLRYPSRAREWLGRLDRIEQPTLACLSYDLGRALEPAVSGSTGVVRDRQWPMAFAASLQPQHVSSSGQHGMVHGGKAKANSFHVGTPISDTSQSAFECAVERALEYIRAGDVYQVNLAHRFSAAFEGCPRAFFVALAEVADPAHGAYIEHVCGETALVVASASPELFLDCDARSRVLRTRPMKGTRPVQGEHEATSRADLLNSVKDQAELAMIVDLMRNDLGKVCDLASVRVEHARQLETHGSRDAQLFQTTATVAGTLRVNATWPDILSATFPGGSITGAPKIRAMQIIEELETNRDAKRRAHRGPYCGSIGLWRPDGSATLNIAIRTACITGTRERDTASQISEGVVDWWVGAGIVADSNPREEWHETLAKTGVFMRVLQR